VQNIHSGAFRNCTALASINIGNSVILIEAGAFENCSMLEYITIPLTTVDIGPYAFVGCANLTIRARIASKPQGWDVLWDVCDAGTNQRCPVVWGYAGA